MKHSEGAYKLGRWVGIQRWQSHAVTNERKQKLDEIGFNWQLTGRSGGNYARKVHASVQGTDINGFADLIFITPPEMQRSMRLLRDKILQLSSVVEKAGRSRTKPGITFTTKRNFARFEILIKWINVYLRDSKYAEDSGGLMHDVSHGTSGWGGVVKLTPDCDLEYIFTLIRASYNSTL
jgi:predicted transport protein